VWSTGFLQIVAYLSVLTFVGLVVARVVKYATMPMHLRWELYPVAHEIEYPSGGSYFEDLDWWTKPRKLSLLEELKFMGIELFFFDSYYRLQRRYWYVVYPFHIGVFLLFAWFVLLLLGALTSVSGISVSAGSDNVWGSIVYYLTLVVGAAGFILATIGCIGLLVERLVDENRRLYLSPMDYFTLSFTLATLLSGLCAWVFFDRAFAADTKFMRSLITFSPAVSMNPATYINILLICLFLIYMPFTTMMHYVAKYFTYHSVRWNDEPNRRGSEVERNVQELLNRPVSWSAPHIKSGKKWNENAVQIGNIGESEAGK
jgi:nitrate reductase gamma subunit